MKPLTPTRRSQIQTQLIQTTQQILKIRIIPVLEMVRAMTMVQHQCQALGQYKAQSSQRTPVAVVSLFQKQEI